MKKIILNVHNSRDFMGNIADKAIVIINDQLRFRILQLAGVVRALCCFCASEIDATPSFMAENWDAEELPDGSQPLKPFTSKMETMRLVVTAHVFYWEGSYQSGSRWTTDSISLSDIDSANWLLPAKQREASVEMSHDLLMGLIERFPQADPESEFYGEEINGCEAVNFLSEFIPKIREYLYQVLVDQGKGKWVHCSPELLKSGVSCADTPRIACQCGLDGSHDHFIATT